MTGTSSFGQHSTRPTTAQISAAREFIRTFGRAPTNGGEMDVRLRLPEKTFMNAMDGGLGTDVALDALARELAEKMLALPYHDLCIALPDGVGDLEQGANAFWGSLRERLSVEECEAVELAGIHPKDWQAAAESCIRAARGEFDHRPFTTYPELLDA